MLTDAGIAVPSLSFPASHSLVPTLLWSNDQWCPIWGSTPDQHIIDFHLIISTQAGLKKSVVKYSHPRTRCRSSKSWSGVGMIWPKDSLPQLKNLLVQWQRFCGTAKRSVRKGKFAHAVESLGMIWSKDSLPQLQCWSSGSASAARPRALHEMARLFMLWRVLGWSRPRTRFLSSRTCSSSGSASMARPSALYEMARLFMLWRVSGCSGPKTRFLSSRTCWSSGSASAARPRALYEKARLLILWRVSR
ncbi:hypothetical protein DL96DRAFT_1563484 [Flagelloscypha sp. PMI_526]|nr:hypothetical protein DL96DRAFT_1563484 [Flagelloscypha sp. PMI_526]